MRRVIYGILDTPWGFRITCGVLFVILMGLARYGLSALRENSDRGTFLTFCGCGFAALCLSAWLVDRHRGRPH